MPIPIALGLGLLAGSAVAWIARSPLRDTPGPVRTRYGAVTALFGLAALMPVTVFLFLLEPAWSVMYVVHPSHAALLVWPVLLAGPAIAPMVGLSASTWILHRSGARGFWAWAAVLAGTFLCVLWMGMRRLGTVTDYEVFHYGATDDALIPGIALAASQIFWPAILAATVLPLLLAFSLVNVQRHAELTDRPPAPGPFDQVDEEEPAAA